ncbi:MAG: bifunctional nuclease family protein [Dehalococcoidia bacterium]|nr:bifunctional nuclease family protein [Dehalococcoidia bacterium]MCK5654183.1 bifunctional nuclease family protein [Dehalococcoidia bacterium]
MIEMIIDSIRMSLMNYQRVVILKEKDGERYLPIWIGPAEADSIAIKLQDVQVPRPMTHDLLRSAIEALGARVNSIFVHDLRNDTFYARILLIVDGKDLEIDSRPSDAIALAVRVEVPIYADESVLEKAGILLPPKGEQDELSEDELSKLSPFKDFIDTLNMDDLGKS